MEFDTAHLLRPSQVLEANEEIARLDAMLQAPPHIAGKISDRGGMRRRRDRLKADTEKQLPRAYSPSERDAAVREFSTLSTEIQAGMPSSEEMRRNPPGAVGKQLAWAKRTKKPVARYKHIALRLLAGGDVPDSLKYEGDVANIERLRPLTTSGQLAMDGAQIPKKVDIHIGADPVNAVTFSDEEIALLTKTSPEAAAQLALLSNETRTAFKTLLRMSMMTPPPAARVKKVRIDVANNEWSRMKRAAKKAGFNSQGMKRDALLAALQSKGVEF